MNVSTTQSEAYLTIDPGFTGHFSLIGDEPVELTYDNVDDPSSGAMRQVEIQEQNADKSKIEGLVYWELPLLDVTSHLQIVTTGQGKSSLELLGN